MHVVSVVTLCQFVMAMGNDLQDLMVARQLQVQRSLVLPAIDIAIISSYMIMVDRLTMG